MSAVLEHWHYDTFLARWGLDWLGEAVVSFALDAKGNAASLELGGARFAREAEAAVDGR
jgi:hypothetical protein